MEFFILLGISTFIIAYLAIAIYRKTRDFSFFIGIGLMYFFSLYGGWFLVFDNLYLEEAHTIGLNYYYLIHKMFLVHLDEYYFKTLLYYAVFIIIVECILLLMVKHVSLSPEIHSILVFNHETILIISAVSLALSLSINFKNIYAAIQEGTGAYFLIRKSTNTSIYAVQILLNKVFMILLIGYLGLLTPNLKYFSYQPRGWGIFLAYPALIALWVIYLIVIGDRYGLFFAVLATSLIYFSLIKRVNKLKLVIVFGGAVILLGCVILLRQYSPSAMIQNFDLDLILFALMYPLLSNEMFAAHLSLYGAMYYQVPLLWGHSFLALIISFIPRFVGVTRLQDIYDYYASSVGAMEGQVYTIHHATGWYLNYGAAGIVAGAALLGLVWGGCYRLKYSAVVDKKYVLLSKIFIPYLLTSGIPLIVRSGIEGYKSLLIDVILLPFFLIFLSVRLKKTEEAV